MRCTSSHFFSVWWSTCCPFLACLRLGTRTFTLRMYAGVPRALPSASSSPSLRPLSSVRDVLWERALSGLLDQLLSALRASELDEPGVLFEYPRVTEEELKGTMGEKLGDQFAPSGAASSSQPATSSLASSTTTSLTSRVASGMVVSVSGDPRTDHVRPMVLRRAATREPTMLPGYCKGAATQEPTSRSLVAPLVTWAATQEPTPLPKVLMWWTRWPLPVLPIGRGAGDPNCHI